MKIYTSLNDKYQEKFRYKGTYLHGLMEFKYQYDIFSFDRDTNYSPGIGLTIWLLPSYYYDMLGLLFTWLPALIVVLYLEE